MEEKELQKQVRKKGKKHIITLWLGFALYLLGDFFGGQYRDFIVIGSMFVVMYGGWNLFKLRKQLDNRSEEVRKEEFKKNSIKKALPLYIIGILFSNFVLVKIGDFHWAIILFTNVLMLLVIFVMYKFMYKEI